MYSTNHNLSLKGITGILVGVVSIIFIFIVKTSIDYFIAGIGIGFIPISFFEFFLAFLSFLYIISLILVIVLINKKRRKKIHLKGWEENSKKIATAYAIAILLGGLICYMFLQNGYLKLIIPTALILYGVTYLLIKKFTNLNSTLFGILFIATSVVNYFFPEFTYFLWTISFGGFHIYYGIYELKLNNP